jgi:hypothetical protein
MNLGKLLSFFFAFLFKLLERLFPEIDKSQTA